MITSAIRVADALDGGGASGRGFYIEDAGYPVSSTGWSRAASCPAQVAPAAAVRAATGSAARLGGSPKTGISADLGALIGAGRAVATARCRCSAWAATSPTA